MIQMKKNVVRVTAILIIGVGITFAWMIKNNERQKNDNVVIDVSPEIIISNNKEESKINEEVITNEEPIINEEPKNHIEIKDSKIENNKEGILPETIQEIDKEDANFNLAVSELDLETLKSYKIPMLIDFGSDSCIPCKQMAPVLKELNSELRGKAIVKFVDIWQYPEASEGFDFSLIPTQFFLDKDGKVYTSHTGAITKEEAVKILVDMGMKE